ncbi:hypothetical protein AGMMS50212_15600 [Spirochaetia bacterium]|nr:hypothetical protein AGMMS50212_15600 [Spirochaetia bacterium]
MKKNDEQEQKTLIEDFLTMFKNLFKKTKLTVKKVAATLVSCFVVAIAFLWNVDIGAQIFTGRLILFIMLYALFGFYSGRSITVKRRSDSEVVLLSLLTAVYYITCVLIRDISFMGDYMPVSIVLPTALIVMLITISVDSRLSNIYALILPLGAFLTGCFDVDSYIFATASGVSGSLVLTGARRRIDLVKSGIIVAGTNLAAVIAVLLLNGCPGEKYPWIIFWSLLNGVASGMLVLGILPIIENALHLATTFKLIELLDVGAPLLKKLAAQAPGTYSHTMMVATLADEACREIGAKGLLARVGAYYHDIGKMDQPDYFVENQTLYNKHNELNPRLSATVIRSHVKLGVEKARAIGLPTEVIDIIAEHHGNSPIMWFYNAAMEREGNVDMEDFCYPGNPPRSKESAAVMLADVTEAATRTLEKPNAARLETFIQKLFDDKVQHDQLAESALTFHDLEVIKNIFVRVLAGHYHHRIEYPKVTKEADKETTPNGDNETK